MSGNVKEKQILIGESTGPISIDKSLTKQGFAADAAVVGHKLGVFEERLNALNPVTAESLDYDNSTSLLKAVNIQSAIDEVSERVADAVSKADEELETALNEINDKMGDYLKAEDKPSGTYTGNSTVENVEEHVINIGGNGNALLVYTEGTDSISSLVLVCPAGAFGLMTSDNHNATLKSNLAKFENGKLTLKTYGRQLNYKGVKYHYQVL